MEENIDDHVDTSLNSRNAVKAHHGERRLTRVVALSMQSIHTSGVLCG